jgi:hypothetical protein
LSPSSRILLLIYTNLRKSFPRTHAGNHFCVLRAVVCSRLYEI